MLPISPTLSIDESEIELHPIRAQGAGGQNVNKVSSALHLRFDIPASSLPEDCKERLLASKDSRISKDGVLILKGQRFRTQEKNREDLLARLTEIIQAANKKPKARKATKPTRASQRRRLESKTQRGRIKSLRGSVTSQD